MGRYSTYRRRGTTPPGAGGLVPPPAPLLSLDPGNVIQTAQGTEDFGGLVRLDYTDTLEDPWFTYQTQPFDISYAWGDPLMIGHRYLRAYEIGNGIVYEGTSQPSNVLDTEA